MHEKIERPSDLAGRTYKVKFCFDTNTHHDNSFITINEDQAGNPVEVFINSGKDGSVLNVANKALGRVVSLYLQRGGDLAELVQRLVGIKNGGVAKIEVEGEKKPIRALSIPDAVGQLLERYTGKEGENGSDQAFPQPRCLECGAELAYGGHCTNCGNCSS